MPIRCILVDDHTLFRAGIRRLLEGEADIEVVGEASDASQALERISELYPDIVLMDIGMPGLSSFEAACLMRTRFPGTRLIFLTMHEDEEYLRQALAAGAWGYLLKDAPTFNLISAVREVHEGHKSLDLKVLNKLRDSLRGRGSTPGNTLTAREREIVKLLAEGNSVRVIAVRLRLSSKTVEAHKFNLMRKLGIHNKAQLVTYAFQKKIVKMPAGV